MTGVYCNQCGHRNAEGANFCSSCGGLLEPEMGDETTVTFAPVEASADGVEEELSVTLGELGESTAVLVVKRGPNAGSKFVLNSGVTTAGRHPDSDVFLDDITVSRRHAEIVASHAGYTVRDAGSLNGTYVNRERIEEGPLANGDEVQIGKFRLVFFSGLTPDADEA
ncbi:MAG: FHA domain-containing protein [Acidimicrobiales bacterium]